jgi:hypothetical protein
MTSASRQLPWPEWFGKRLHLFALGEAFDVDTFLAESKLHPDYVWRQWGNGPANGLAFLLEGQKIPLPRQEQIAINYLAANRDELRRLVKFPGVEAVNLGMVYYCSPEAVGFCVGPSPKLMWHALDTGVNPNYYGILIGHPIESAPRSTL